MTTATDKVWASRQLLLTGYEHLTVKQKARFNAALAAEAAAEQGEFEAMHDKLFETQDEWGHSESSQAKVFEGYAEELGLDMAEYRKDIKDPALKKRIEQSEADARDLGVTGTPTFFIDGEKFEPSTVEDFDTALDEAIAD